MITEYKDWKGNLFKDGDVMIKVRTQPLLMSSAFYIMDLSSGEQLEEVYKPKETESKHCWVPYDQAMVIKSDNGKLYAKTEDYLVDLSIVFNFDGQPNEIFCIKGVSDNEEEYYKAFFNV